MALEDGYLINQMTNSPVGEDDNQVELMAKGGEGGGGMQGGGVGTGTSSITGSAQGRFYELPQSYIMGKQEQMSQKRPDLTREVTSGMLEGVISSYSENRGKNMVGRQSDDDRTIKERYPYIF